MTAPEPADPLSRLPWRGPGPDRPELPLPPGRMPLRRGSRLLKKWRYLGVFCDELLLCAARVRVGVLGQTFWAVVERETGAMHENTRLLLPGARGEVWYEGPEHVEGSGRAVDHVMAGREVRIRVHVREGEAVESVCPSGDGAYVWTRKLCDVPVECDVRVGEKRWKLEARGVLDESRGYHPRHTVWSWSAGVGRSDEGRSVGWNLVSGINDPPRGSERAIWIDGRPTEPGPVSFEGLGAIAFADGARLRFSAEQERRSRQRLPLVRYEYRQPFGSFAGTLEGGIELERGLGVMEHHDAHW